MIRRKLVTRRNRRKLDPSQLAPSSDVTATVTVVATKAQVNFSGVVVVSGILQMTANGALPIAQTVDSPSQITLDYTANVVAAQPWVIPSKDPAIRTGTGGFVTGNHGVF